MYHKSVSRWLILGCVLVFFQVVIGGVTRLTGSGLSITKWEIVIGTLPPLSTADWEEAFALYRETPQFRQINYDMTMEEFKFIYFWEYFHRFWARWMGLVFFFPFLYFNRLGYIDSLLKRQLYTVVGWAAIIASFGWIMVASGLIDKPYVSPLKLSLHLSLALGLFAYLVHITVAYHGRSSGHGGAELASVRWWYAAIILLFLQLFLGGIVSGMKAGLAFNTWPGMHGTWIPEIIQHSPWAWGPFMYYDSSDVTAKALIQFFHRNTAFLFCLLVLFLSFKSWPLASVLQRRGIVLILLALFLQISLGIITVLHCVGSIPVFWGELHQIGAMLLLCSFSFAIFHFRSAQRAFNA
jgi:cytochrome c oxidase assembly protein subunit 15